MSSDIILRFDFFEIYILEKILRGDFTGRFHHY